MCAAAVAVCMLALPLLTGCETYHLRGRVIQGSHQRIEVVEATDGRLQIDGVADAQIEFILDPTSLQPIKVGTFYTDLDGSFSVPIEETGAGFLEYELGVLVRADGYSDLWHQRSLPGSNKLLLIVMQRGSGEVVEPESIEEMIEEGKRLSK